MKIKTIATGSKGNCYVINDEILIECGLSFKKLKNNMDLSKIHTCLISHEHDDHAHSIIQLETKMNIYATKGTIKSYGAVLTKPLKDKQVIHTHEYVIEVFKCVHDVEIFGFVIKNKKDKLLYASDTKTLNVYFSQVTHLMIECNYDYKLLKHNKQNSNIFYKIFDRVEETHMNVINTFDYISNMNFNFLKEVHLIHMSNSNINNDIINSYIPQTKIKYYIGEKLWDLEQEHMQQYGK